MKFTKKNGGFTLVELIVVIAILAILAAIAVPAYSGYIKKANEAGDQQLLAAVNTAYAAACLENNQDMLTLGGATVTMDGNTITKIAPFGVESTDPFWVYFGGNTPTFKTITKLVFDKSRGVFCQPADAVSVGFAYYNSSFGVSGDTINKLNNSVWSDEEAGMGATAVLNKVDGVTDYVEGFLGLDENFTDKLMSDENFWKNYAASVGMTEAEIAAKMEDLGEGTTYKDAVIGLSQDEKYFGDNAEDSWVNGLVLYAAQNTAGQKSEDMLAMLKDTNKLANISKQEPGTMVSQAALAYGMYTAYIYGDDTLTDKQKADMTSDPKNILSTISTDTKFQEYLAKDEAKADLEAYMAALGTINDATTDNPDAAKNLMDNGFNDPELIKLLESVMGQ